LHVDQLELIACVSSSQPAMEGVRPARRSSSVKSVSKEVVNANNGVNSEESISLNNGGDNGLACDPQVPEVPVIIEQIQSEDKIAYKIMDANSTSEATIIEVPNDIALEEGNECVLNENGNVKQNDEEKKCEEEEIEKEEKEEVKMEGKEEETDVFESNSNECSESGQAHK
jgi:hypothetical protein